MRLRSAKRVLRTRFDASLGNTRFSDNSLDLVICATGCDVSLRVIIDGVELSHRVLELAGKHHDRVALGPLPAISLLI